MLLHFSALSDVLSTMHDIPPDLHETTRSRLKYFANRHFPLPQKTKGKARIGLDGAFQVAFAFELLQAGMGPLRAIRLTSSDWPLISQRIAAAWRETSEGRGAAPLRLAPHALSEMKAVEDMRDIPLSEVIGDEDEVGSKGRVMITIDVGAMTRSFGAALLSKDKPRLDRAVRPGDFERAMDAYADAVIGEPSTDAS